MKIRTFDSIEAGVYKVIINTQEWSQGDQLLMEKFGEPEIDVGGTFTNPAFTLPSNLVRIMSGSPISQTFDSADMNNAQARAARWTTDITTRITSAVTTLRQNTDTFTGEAVTTV